MLVRSISIVLLSLGEIVICYATGLCCHAASRDEGARELAAGLLLGVTLIAFAVLVDRDRRRHDAGTPAVAAEPATPEIDPVQLGR